MYNLSEGENLVKYNPVYTLSTHTHRFPQQTPTGQVTVRWEWYKQEFKNISPHVR